MNNDHKIRGTVCGIAATVTWGINGTVSQYVLQHYDLDSMWLACWRMLFAGFVIFLFTIIRKGRGCFEILKDKKSLRDLIIFAVFGLLFNQLCYRLTLCPHCPLFIDPPPPPPFPPLGGGGVAGALNLLVSGGPLPPA